MKVTKEERTHQKICYVITKTSSVDQILTLTTCTGHACITPANDIIFYMHLSNFLVVQDDIILGVCKFDSLWVLKIYTRC